MSLAIALLAAGGATRFGGGKLDAQCAGKPLGQWALDTALALPHERLTVVVGDPVPAFARGCELLVNERAGEGLGTSAALAARWAAGSDALLIMLADMPLVSAETLRQLAAADEPAAVAYPGNKPGVPACFPAALFPALAALRGDSGAAQVLRSLAGVTLTETSPQELRDVDRSEDLADVEALLRAR
uniref:NTP transferase domain-containing protein n=1 Tax=Altererythrobacter segetis TaxID=1104773 RepID=UPI00140CFF3F|nr:NTP transferase domain-containing protein [Altererythrobacter segetis]